MSDVELTRYQLPPDEHERVFREEIVPFFFVGRTPQERPVAVFVGG
ncbi:hypothetical protein [Frankia sp. Cas3]|nr:hypothetical protein [Frankia sp. Cas3]